MLWLAAASLFFYGWWDVRFIGLLLGSIVFNFSASYFIGHKILRNQPVQARMLLIGAIACNLVLLGYYKYANFFTENLNQFAGLGPACGRGFSALGHIFFYLYANRFFGRYLPG